MNDETLEAAFKDYWQTTFPEVTDENIHILVRSAFLSGAGHIALRMSEVGYDRGVLAVKKLVDQWALEMDSIVNADRKPSERLVRRVPVVPGSNTPDKH